ncbi:MAG TPA: TonB family protein [Candidatus Limnocylindrales bacterium]|jgi:TonB family protein|nr:TonB family protein [Candidatus Limnocylindrales bacterium]
MATQPTESKPRVRAGGDDLTVIAQRAQAFTNASGTAIALSEGNADEIVCRARSGSAAPEVGTALRVEGSFTGLCIQSGKELRCDDAETDTRVDTAAIRALGIKSMVVTPIKDDNKVIGVIACFAPTAHAFTITHVAVLKTMSDQISVLLQKERRMREEGIEPAAPAPRQAPGPVIVKPAPVSSTPVSSGPAVAAAPARTPVPVANKVEVRPAPLAAEVATPLAVPKFEEKQKPEIRASFGTFDSVAGEEKKSGGQSKLIGLVAMIAVVAAITFYFVKGHKTAAASTSAAQPAAEAMNTPAQPQPGPVSNSGPAATVSTSSSSYTPSASTAASKPAPLQVEAKRAEKPAPKPQDKAAAPEPSQPKSEPMTVSLNSAPSRLHASSGQSSDVAPVMMVGSSNASGALSSLTRPVTSTTPGMAQSELEPMKILKTVPPIYPEIAKLRRLSGDVVVEVKVNKDGKVSGVKYISGQQVFTDAAADAVRQWKFKPAMLNGQPIEQSTQIKVAFHP